MTMTATQQYLLHRREIDVMIELLKGALEEIRSLREVVDTIAARDIHGQGELDQVAGRGSSGVCVRVAHARGACAPLRDECLMRHSATETEGEGQ